MVKKIMVVFLSILLVLLLITAAALYFVSPGTVKPYTNSDGQILNESISEKIFVEINGVKQGMFIKGKNVNNPVLLFLHGGPGMPTYFLSEDYPTGLEDYFTVCYWEQRGGGISYNSDIPPASITLDQLISDAVEVTKYLQKRFDKKKIYLMGHSWGSFLGIQTASKAPEFYHAYLGIAQIVNQSESEKLGYKYMIEKYSASGKTSMAEKFGRHNILNNKDEIIPYFKSTLRDEAMHELGIGTMHNMKSVVTGIFVPIMQCKAFTFNEKINLWRAKAILKNETRLIPALFSTDLMLSVPELKIPVYFFCGEHDYTVNYSLSRKYFDHIKAPAKQFYSFSSSAHSPMHEEPKKFINIIKKDLLKVN